MLDAGGASLKIAGRGECERALQGGVFRRLVNRPEEGGVQYIGDTEWDQREWDLGAFEAVEVEPVPSLSKPNTVASAWGQGAAPT